MTETFVAIALVFWWYHVDKRSRGYRAGPLMNGGVIAAPGPTVNPPFRQLTRRVLADGGLAAANAMEDIGLLTRPIVTQVSRWDRLKGFLPLMRAFASLKRTILPASGA